MYIVPWIQVSDSLLRHVLPVAVNSIDDQLERRRLLIEIGLPPKWLPPYCPATDLRAANFDELCAWVDVQAYLLFCGEQHGL